MEFEFSDNLHRKHLSSYGGNISLKTGGHGTFSDDEHGIFFRGTKMLDRIELAVNGTALSKADKAYAKLWGSKFLYAVKGLEIERSIIPGENNLLEVLHIINTSAKKQNVRVAVKATLARKKTSHHRLFDKIRDALIVQEEGHVAVLGLGRVEQDHSVAHPYKNDVLMHHVHKKHTSRDVDGYSASFSLAPRESLSIPLIFSFSSIEDEAIAAYDRIHGDWKGVQLDAIQQSRVYEKVETPLIELNRAFAWSVHLVNQLPNHDFPLTRQDVLWMSQALLDLGKYSESRRLLDNLQDRDPLLFSFAAANYAEQSDDKEFVRNMERLLTEAKRKLVLENYVVQSDDVQGDVDKTDWLSSSIEQQALWSEALKTTYLRTSYQLRKALETTFWDDDAGTFYSSPVDGKKTNSGNIDSRFLLPLAFGQVSQERAEAALNEIRENYAALYGVSLKPRNAKAARFVRDTAYAALTGMAATACFQYGRIDEGIRFLNDVALLTEKEHAGHIAEFHSPTDVSGGRLTNVAAHALLIHAVDRHLFGFSSKAGRVIIEPKLPSDWPEMKRKHKIVGDSHLSFSLRRNGPGFEGELKVQGKQKPSVELVFPPHVKEVNVNGKVQTGHRILFKPDEVNLFVARA